MFCLLNLHFLPPAVVYLLPSTFIPYLAHSFTNYQILPSAHGGFTACYCLAFHVLSFTFFATTMHLR